MREEEEGVSWMSGCTCDLFLFLNRCLTITATVKRRNIAETDEAVTVMTKSQDTPGSGSLLGVSRLCQLDKAASSDSPKLERSSSLSPDASFVLPILVPEEVVVVVTHLVVVIVVVATVVVVVVVVVVKVVVDGRNGPSVMGTPCKRRR